MDMYANPSYNGASSPIREVIVGNEQQAVFITSTTGNISLKSIFANNRISMNVASFDNEHEAVTVSRDQAKAAIHALLNVVNKDDIGHKAFLRSMVFAFNPAPAPSKQNTEKIFENPAYDGAANAIREIILNRNEEKITFVSSGDVDTALVAAFEAAGINTAVAKTDKDHKAVTIAQSDAKTAVTALELLCEQGKGQQAFIRSIAFAL